MLKYAGGSVSGGSATGGAGGKSGGTGAADGQAGQGYGAGLFIMGNQNLTFAPGSGETLTISDQITDQSGSDPNNLYNAPGSGGLIVDGLGVVVLAASNTFTADIKLESGTLDLTAFGAAGSGAIQFAGSPNAKLEFSKADAPTTVIKGFAQGDEIRIDGFTTTTHAFAGNMLTLSGPNGGVTFDLAGVNDGDLQFINDAQGTLIVSDANPCYARGTLIRTERGEAPVETLAIGDKVTTVSGEAKPIVWIGHRRLDLTKHPRPEQVWPVRVAAGAFADRLPRRDLWLSPRHAVAVEGVLIPIVALLNGASVQQVKAHSVEYWHVELDAHDVIVAEGLPAKSYLDNGNRTAFVNGAAFVEAHPDFEPKHWRDTCLPLVEDGPELDLTKQRLFERLEILGYALGDDADPHVLANGRRIEPIRLGEDRIGFVLPEGCKTATLTSRTFVPAQLHLHSTDGRELGLCAKRLSVDGEDVALDAEALPGWNEAEGAPGVFSHRWTRGAAPLPPGARIVIVDLAGSGRYWREPETRRAAGSA